MREMSNSSTITEDSGDSSPLSLIPPGEVLLHEFMVPHGLTQSRLARDLGINAGRVSEIVHGRQPIRADLALRLGRYFGTTPDMWLALQMDYDLRRARRELGSTVVRQVRPLQAA